jgi:probable phosphoglycerate mutase
MGTRDVACGVEGLERARAMSASVRELRPCRVYASPLRRAIATARVLFAPDFVIASDGRLIERSLGEWEGQPTKEIRRAHPEAFRGRGVDPDAVPPGGESLEALRQRVAMFLSDVAAEVGRDPAGPVVLVTHNGVIRMVRHLLHGVSLEAAFARSEPHLEPIRVRTSWEALVRLRALGGSSSA